MKKNEHNPKLVVIRFAGKQRKYHYFHFFEGKEKLSTSRAVGTDVFDHNETIDVLKEFFEADD